MGPSPALWAEDCDTEVPGQHSAGIPSDPGPWPGREGQGPACTAWSGEAKGTVGAAEVLHRTGLTPGGSSSAVSLCRRPGRRRCLMGLWAEPMRPPSVKCVSHTPQVVRGIRVFCMRGFREILVSLLMLCKLPISSLEFFREKRPRKKRSLINTITLPVGPAGSLLSGILTFSGGPTTGTLPSPEYLHPSSVPTPRGGGLQTLTVSPLPLHMSSPFAVYLQCSFIYKYLYMENTDTK